MALRTIQKLKGCGNSANVRHYILVKMRAHHFKKPLRVQLPTECLPHTRENLRRGTDPGVNDRSIAPPATRLPTDRQTLPSASRQIGFSVHADCIRC